MNIFTKTIHNNRYKNIYQHFYKKSKNNLVFINNRYNIAHENTPIYYSIIYIKFDRKTFEKINSYTCTTF